MSEQGLCRRIGLGVVAMTLAAGFVPVGAFAQSRLVAPREGNIWDWKPHQPTRGGTLAKEKSAGVALPAPQRQRLTGEVERLDRELLAQPNGVGQ
jgi:hypothetical protein